MQVHFWTQGELNWEMGDINNCVLVKEFFFFFEIRQTVGKGLFEDVMANNQRV